MPNHSNRGPQGPSRNPRPAEIRASREAAGLTQTAAGALVHTTCRTWQQWEAGDRRMHPAVWELWRRKTAERQAFEQWFEKYAPTAPELLDECVKDAWDAAFQAGQRRGA